jgi:hypothetical protein
MDWTDFFIGVGLITAAYLVYRDVKGKSLFPKSKFPDKTPNVDTSYTRSWSAVIVFIVAGIYFIILSFNSFF